VAVNSEKMVCFCPLQLAQPDLVRIVRLVRTFFQNFPGGGEEIARPFFPRFLNKTGYTGLPSRDGSITLRP
jgi:hypothetical protein